LFQIDLPLRVPPPLSRVLFTLFPGFLFLSFVPDTLRPSSPLFVESPPSQIASVLPCFFQFAECSFFLFLTTRFFDLVYHIVLPLQPTQSEHDTSLFFFVSPLLSPLCFSCQPQFKRALFFLLFLSGESICFFLFFRFTFRRKALLSVFVGGLCGACGCLVVGVAFLPPPSFCFFVRVLAFPFFNRFFSQPPLFSPRP